MLQFPRLFFHAVFQVRLLVGLYFVVALSSICCLVFLLDDLEYINQRHTQEDNSGILQVPNKLTKQEALGQRVSSRSEDISVNNKEANDLHGSHAAYYITPVTAK